MRFPLSVILLLSASAAKTQSTDSSDVAAIRAADAAWFAAEAARDIESIMPFVSDRAVFQPPDGPAIVGAEAVRNFYQSFFALPYTDAGGSSDSIVVSSSGDLAYDIGRNFLVLKGPEGERRHDGKYLAVWQKSGGTWKLTALSWSLDAPMR
jgi:ketosteroid isomerase-like protein